jgi:hypothetical protein
MSDAKDLREHAGRLLALANKFREQGQSAYAEMLTVKAGQTLDEAVTLEMAFGRARAGKAAAQGPGRERF